MGNDNKTVRSKINTLTVLCENLWPILYYLGVPLLALSSGSSRMYRKSTDKLFLTVLLSLLINDLPYIKLFSISGIVVINFNGFSNQISEAFCWSSNRQHLFEILSDEFHPRLLL